jgi:hypothetical protein
MTATERRQLVFIYNADGTVAGKVKDFLHKAIRPDTYPCSLCAMTYGYTSMRAEWRTFVDSLDADVEFLHRDELRVEHSPLASAALPAAWQMVDGTWQTLVDVETMNACDDLQGLMATVTTNLLPAGPPDA